MILYIDTTDRQKITIGFDDILFETTALMTKSQKLLPFLEEILTQKGKTIHDISAIKVKTGPGSFTGIRVGVAVANTLAWTLKIPVNGKSILLDFDY